MGEISRAEFAESAEKTLFLSSAITASSARKIITFYRLSSEGWDLGWRDGSVYHFGEWQQRQLFVS